LNIKIHRGTKQIGGCITEIFTEKTRIFIDMGAELPDENCLPKDIDIDGVTKGIKKCDAVFFTHYHGDHLGLYKKILPDVPVYIGETAKEIFIKLSERIDKLSLPIINRFLTFHALQRVIIGDMTVIPFLIDHSAYDAYMFLIEAGGKKILHTGDFRLHGFRGSKTINMLKQYVGQVDVVITEGTVLSRGNEKMDSERELQMKARPIMKDKKYVFVLCASTNIDRIAAFYQTNPAGRYFLCDHYQKEILDIVSKTGGARSPLYSFTKAKTYGENLEERFQTQGFCMLIRATPYFKEIMARYESEKSVIIYSMWKGYLGNKPIADILNGVDYEYIHTSGHATKEAIKTVCEAVSPSQAIIPIHSENPEEIRNLNISYPIIILKDKEIFKMR